MSSRERPGEYGAGQGNNARRRLMVTAMSLLLTAGCVQTGEPQHRVQPDAQPTIALVPGETAQALAEAEHKQQAIANHAARLADKYIWGADEQRETGRQYHTALVKTARGGYHFQAAYANQLDIRGTEPVDLANIDRSSLVDLMVTDDAGTVLLRATDYQPGAIEPMLFAGGLNRRHARGWGLSANPPLSDVPAATPADIDHLVATTEQRLDG